MGTTQADKFWRVFHPPSWGHPPQEIAHVVAKTPQDAILKALKVDSIQVGDVVRLVEDRPMGVDDFEFTENKARVELGYLVEGSPEIIDAEQLRLMP